jgi:bifunctional DNA-binding transcriptional regulator/antitoxin component of YhaV-PrlF toxin-antitoxin module
MTKVVKINSGGTLTLPKELRARLGVETSERTLIAEETKDGVLLRAPATFPVEIYTEERISEFSQNNENALASFPFK